MLQTTLSWGVWWTSHTFPAGPDCSWETLTCPVKVKSIISEPTRASIWAVLYPHLDERSKTRVWKDFNDVVRFWLHGVNRSFLRQIILVVSIFFHVQQRMAGLRWFSISYFQESRCILKMLSWKVKQIETYSCLSHKFWQDVKILWITPSSLWACSRWARQSLPSATCNYHPNAH